MDNECRVLQKLDINNVVNANEKLDSAKNESSEVNRGGLTPFKQQEQTSSTENTPREPQTATGLPPPPPSLNFENSTGPFSPQVQTKHCVVINQIDDQLADLENKAESSGSSELGSGVTSPSSSLYLSTTASPNRKYGTVSSSENSLYYSVCGDSQNSLVEGNSSGAESDWSLDATVVLGEVEDHLVSGSEDTITDVATPVNYKTRSFRSSLEGSGSTCGSESNERRFFDKTSAADCTTVLFNVNERLSSVKKSFPHDYSQSPLLQFKSSDQVDFDTLPTFDSPLRRPTFSLGIPSTRLPVDKPLLQPQRSQSSSDSDYSSLKPDSQFELRESSKIVLEEFEEPISNKSESELDSSFFGSDPFCEPNSVSEEDSNNNRTFDRETADQEALLPCLQEESFQTGANRKTAIKDKSEEGILRSDQVVPSQVSSQQAGPIKMASAYDNDDDFDFEAVADPFKSSNKMMMDSPPLPRKNNAGVDYDNIDFDAIENPFASSKNLMQDSPPGGSPAPIESYNPGSLDALEEDSSGQASDQLPEMNGSATITRPSAHSKTKTKTPPHKARRSANTKLSSESELKAKLLTGAGDAATENTNGLEDGKDLAKKAPPPVPKRASSSAQAQPDSNSAKIVAPSAVTASVVQTTEPTQLITSSGDTSYVTDTEQSSYSIIQGENNRTQNDSHDVEEQAEDEAFPPPPKDEDFPPPPTEAFPSPPTVEEFPPPPAEEDFPPPPSDNELTSEVNPETANEIGANPPSQELEEAKPSAGFDNEDFDFEAVADPFKSSKKMMMDSPPLPRKNNTAGIDYDNLDFDAIADPFASSKNMMSSSPPENEPVFPVKESSFKDGFTAQIDAGNTKTGESEAPNLTTDNIDQPDGDWQVNKTPASSLEVAKSLKAKVSSSATPTLATKDEESFQNQGTIVKSKAKRALVNKNKENISTSNLESKNESSEKTTDVSETPDALNKTTEFVEINVGLKPALDNESLNSNEKSIAPSNNRQVPAALKTSDLPANVKEDFFKEYECLRDENVQMKEDLTKLRNEEAGTMVVLQDLEDAFSQLCVIKDKAMKDLQNDINRLSQENEEYQNDLQSLEQSFDQALKRYTKARDAIGQYKNNEVILKQELQKAHQKIAEEEKMYETLKRFSEERFTEAEEQAQEKERALKGSITQLEMELKRLKMANDALQLSYDQKVKDNKEMNELCENLISKLAGRE